MWNDFINLFAKGYDVPLWEQLLRVVLATILGAIIGLERELKKESDITNAIGKYICIRTYEKVENLKEIYGDLESYDGNTFVLNCLIKGRKKTIVVEKNKVSKVRMAVKF